MVDVVLVKMGLWVVVLEWRLWVVLVMGGVLFELGCGLVVVG